MAIYTEEEIEKFRRRWEGKDELIEKVVTILKGEKEINDIVEMSRRINEANDFLSVKGFSPLEEIEGPNKIRIPALDLRGVDLRVRDCNYIVLISAHLEGFRFDLAHLEGARLDQSHLEGAIFDYAHLKGARFIGAHLEGARFYEAHLEGAGFDEAHIEGARFDGAHLEGASFNRAHLEGAVFNGAHLEGTWFMRAHFEGARFDLAHLEGTVFYGAHLEGTMFDYAHLEGAKLDGAHLEGADFSHAELGEFKKYSFDEDCHLPQKRKDELNRSLEEGQRTAFAHNGFLPRWRDHFKGKILWKNLWKHFSDRWFYTEFENVRIDDADTVMAADLYRYIKDQQFLYRFKSRHPIIYKIWKIFSDCGGRLLVVFLWSLFFIGLFAFLYGIIPSQPINPEPFFKYSEDLPVIWKWIYVSFDIFSNLGIRSTYPNNPLGVILMICESILGFMMLGMLISVLANRFARRS